MLNVRSVEKFVAERFPDDAVRLQYFEVRQQAVVWMHGWSALRQRVPGGDLTCRRQELCQLSLEAGALPTT